MPPDTTRCELCGIPLQIQVERPNGSARFVFPNHTAEMCKAATLERIGALTGQLTQANAARRYDQHALDDLGRWIACMTDIVDAGRKWLPLRQKRADDIARLRGAFGTAAQEVSPRSPQHPLWVAEGEVAEAIQKAISQVEIQKTRMP